MIVSGHLLLESAPQDTALRLGWFRVESGQIMELAEGPCPHTPDIGDDSTVICPGFVDPHVHLPQFAILGTNGESLLAWLSNTAFPEEMRWENVDYALEKAEWAITQMYRHGTTTFAGFLTSHHDSATAVMRWCQSRGVSACLGQVLQDCNSPSELQRPTDDQLQELQLQLKQFPPGGRLAAAITPRFAPTCSPALLLGCGRLGQSSGALIQTHLAETPEECQVVQNIFGMDYVRTYAHFGLLGPHSVFAHGIWLDDSQARTLAESHSAIIQCPGSNEFLGSGTMDFDRLQQHGLRIGLGSDIGGGFHRSLVREARLQWSTRHPASRRHRDAGYYWWEITAGNAAILGRTQQGRLAVGCDADFLVLRPDLPWQSSTQPLSQLLFGWDDRWLVQTLIRGRTVFQGTGLGSMQATATTSG